MLSKFSWISKLVVGFQSCNLDFKPVGSAWGNSAAFGLSNRSEMNDNY